MVKLTDKKIRWIVRHVGRDVSAHGAAHIYGVSERRIQQLLKSYRDMGEIQKVEVEPEAKDPSSFHDRAGLKKRAGLLDTEIILRKIFLPP